MMYAQGWGEGQTIRPDVILSSTQDYLDPKLLFGGGQADRHRI